MTIYCETLIPFLV